LLVKRLFNKKLQLIIEFIKKKGKQTVIVSFLREEEFLVAWV